MLRDAGLVAVRPEGQRRLYVVRPEGLAGLRDFLDESWAESLRRRRRRWSPVMTADPVTASVHIDAPPERVYEYFTRADAIVTWMGDYAVLEASPGGQFTVDVKGAPVRGRFLALDPPHQS